MIGGLDPAVQAAIIGLFSVVATVLVQHVVGRGQRRRDELKEAKAERDLEYQRRRDAQKECEETGEKLKVMRDERDKAELLSRTHKAEAEDAIGRMNAAYKEMGATKEEGERLRGELRERDVQVEALREEKKTLLENWFSRKIVASEPRRDS